MNPLVDTIRSKGFQMNEDKETGNYLGLCPFHKEKTPSFVVDPLKQRYYCFSCGVDGNQKDFLRHIGKQKKKIWAYTY